ncbi:MAG TPA: DNA mismatch repair protein MutS, partial [Porphyromonadaceae bacterium]|nr:DNA mismatch repair protein MutS [Porphyromonadaceae bacterium]
MQEELSVQTGIQGLRISFNNVFGYYIEVRNSQKQLVPEDWIRKQTVVNAERYITKELKEYEGKILGAEEKILSIEQKLFEELLEHLLLHLREMQEEAVWISKWDCLLSMAELALKEHYVCPDVNDGYDLEIEEGRHPVIETMMPMGETYIPNSLNLNEKDCQIMMITGP